MKLFGPLFALAASAAFAGDPNTLTDAEQAAGWKLLFDGRTTAGWVAIGKGEFPAKGWRVSDGTLHHATKGGGDIVTSEHFQDFELAWEWKIAPGANGGLKYNLADPVQNVGFEYQMIDDAGYPKARELAPAQLTGALYALLETSSDKKLKPAGEWNASRILVKGNHVEHWLNGGKVLEFEMGGEALKAAIAKSKFRDAPKFGEKTKSPILIQDHGDECWLRGLKIRVLQ